MSSSRRLKHLSTRVPEIAALFGIEPQKSPRRRRRGRGAKSDQRGGQPKTQDKPAPKPKAEASKADEGCGGGTEG